MINNHKKFHVLFYILSGILFCLPQTSYAKTVELDHGGNRTSVTDSILTGTIDTSQISATSPVTVRFFRGAGKYALDEGADSHYKRSVKLSKFYEPFGTDYVAPWKLVRRGERPLSVPRNHPRGGGRTEIPHTVYPGASFFVISKNISHNYKFL